VFSDLRGSSHGLLCCYSKEELEVVDVFDVGKCGDAEAPERSLACEATSSLCLFSVHSQRRRESSEKGKRVTL